MAPTATPPAPTPDAAVVAALGKPGSRRGRWFKWLAALLVLALGGTAATVAWQRAKKRAIPGYITAVVERRDLKVTVTATGTMEPANMVDVGAEISGRLVSVLVDFNDAVKKGQLLAEIDPEPWRIRVAEAKAQAAAAEASIAQAQAALEEATAALSRTDELAKKGYVPPQQLETAKAARARAAASVALAKAQAEGAAAGLAAAQSSLRKTAIRAPMDGLVLSRKVEKGQTMAAAFAAPVLFTLAQDLTHMTLHVNVDESDVGRVKAGQAAYFTVDAYPSRRFPAAITEVRNAPKTIQNVVTYDAVLTVDNSEHLLRPGMTATAVISTEVRPGVLLVPNAALRFAPPTPANGAPKANKAAPLPGKREETVWTHQGGVLKAVTVETGPTDGEFTELVAGPLEEDDPVVVDVERKVP